MVILEVNLIIILNKYGWALSAEYPQTDLSDMMVSSALLITISMVARILADSLLNSQEKTRLVTEKQASLIEETRRQSEQLKMLNQISVSVASALDLEKVLVELHEQLKQVVPVHSYYVALFDQKMGLVTFPIFISGNVREYIQREKLDKGSGLTGEVLRTKKLLYLPDLSDPLTQKEHEIVWVGVEESRTYVGIPLHLRGEVIGVLSVQAREANVYTLEQVQVLETIASQVSVAIDNALLFQEVNLSLKREESLNQIARLIGSTLDKDFILRSVNQLSIELLNADAGSLGLTSSDGMELSEFYDLNLPPDIQGKPLKKGQGLLWSVVESGKSALIENFPTHKTARPEFKNAGFFTAAASPILSGDECLGALGVLSKDPLKTFDERDLELLEAVGRSTGAAIQNARLFSSLQQELAERQKVEKALQQRDAMMEAITYAAERFLSVSDWRPIIKDVIERLGTEAHVSQTFLIQVDTDKKGISRTSLEGVWNAPGAEALQLMSHENTPAVSGALDRWGKSLSQGKPFIGSTSSTSQYRFLPEENQFYIQHGIGSLLSVPIFIGDTWWGGIGFVDEREDREWLEVETDTLIIAAGLLSAAIQRQRDDKALRQANIKLEQRVKARTAELESFVYSVSHDLRTPLRGISGYSQLLKDDYGSTLKTQATEYLENVLKSAHRMGIIIDDLLKLSHVGRAEIRNEEIDFSSMVTELMEEAHQRYPDRVVEVLIQPEVKAYGDRNLLQLVLSNLIDNAWKFTGQRKFARIAFSAEHIVSQTVYRLTDNGVGFDMKQHDKIFMAFQRLHAHDKFEGTGIGLATVQRVIARHGGQIWAEGEVNQGATIYFTLPDPGVAKEKKD